MKKNNKQGKAERFQLGFHEAECVEFSSETADDSRFNLIKTNDSCVSELKDFTECINKCIEVSEMSKTHDGWSRFPGYLEVSFLTHNTLSF